ncbi:MAG: hypothetical protein VX240_01875, partial [Actinomycetota bacterium]|nr:hypothetical protein [Actinomycetota bacterium]
MSTFRFLGLAAPGPTGHPASPGDEYVLDVEPPPLRWRRLRRLSLVGGPLGPESQLLERIDARA